MMFLAWLSCASALVVSGTASKLKPVTAASKRPVRSTRGGAVMMSPGTAWAAYNNALVAKPVITKALTSFTGFTIADILAQKLAERKPTWDVMRTVRMGGFGILWHGPSGHYIYGFMDKLIPGNSFKAVFSKVGLDQLVHNPCFAIIFFTYLNFAEGKSFSTLVKTIKRDFWTAVTGSYLYWVPAHIINFRFISTQHRVLYINIMQVVWNMFLSVIGNKKTDGATA